MTSDPTGLPCDGMQELGKVMVVAGAMLVIAGIFVWFGWGRSWFGRLPGDIHLSGEKFSFHFPLVTCLLISAVLSAVLWLLRR